MHAHGTAGPHATPECQLARKQHQGSSSAKRLSPEGYASPQRVEQLPGHAVPGQQHGSHLRGKRTKGVPRPQQGTRRRKRARTLHAFGSAVHVRQLPEGASQPSSQPATGPGSQTSLAEQWQRRWLAWKREGAPLAGLGSAKGEGARAQGGRGEMRWQRPRHGVACSLGGRPRASDASQCASTTARCRPLRHTHHRSRRPYTLLARLTD